MEPHARVVGGNYGGRITSRKVLHAGLWWLTLNGDATDYARTCDVFQRMGKTSQRYDMTLVPQVKLHPFDKWAVDFMRPINPPGKRTGAWYIITTTDYLTRWEKATPMAYCMAATVAILLFENLVTRFGCPKILMSY